MTGVENNMKGSIPHALVVILESITVDPDRCEHPQDVNIDQAVYLGFT